MARLLFTACADPRVWNDTMTGLESRPLGAEEYRRLLLAAGAWVSGVSEDEGRNHYFDAVKTGAAGAGDASLPAGPGA